MQGQAVRTAPGSNAHVTVCRGRDRNPTAAKGGAGGAAVSILSFKTRYVLSFSLPLSLSFSLCVCVWVCVYCNGTPIKPSPIAESNLETFWHDTHQASLMLLLRAKLDTALHQSTLPEKDKYFVRHQRQTFFMTFPVERLWLYLKIARNMDKFDSDDFTVQIAELALSGPEDKYAKGGFLFSAPFPLGWLAWTGVSGGREERTGTNLGRIVIAYFPERRGDLVPQMFYRGMT